MGGRAPGQALPMPAVAAAQRQGSNRTLVMLHVSIESRTASRSREKTGGVATSSVVGLTLATSST